MSIQAVYENGVLRPVTPLALTEGECVELTVVASAAIEAARLAQKESDAREIEIINQNIDALSAEAWDALKYQVALG